jgi:hypothetical protein
MDSSSNIIFLRFSVNLRQLAISLISSIVIISAMILPFSNLYGWRKRGSTRFSWRNRVVCRLGSRVLKLVDHGRSRRCPPQG